MQKQKARAISKRNGRQGGGDTELGKRGAVVALAKTGVPFSDIANITGIKEQTARSIFHRVIKNTESNKENNDPLAEANLKPRHRTGRPVKFDAEKRRKVIDIATANASQRRKPFNLLAKECPFQISRHTLAAILRDAGYSQCIPEENQKSPRLILASGYSSVKSE